MAKNFLGSVKLAPREPGTMQAQDPEPKRQDENLSKSRAALNYITGGASSALKTLTVKHQLINHIKGGTPSALKSLKEQFSTIIKNHYSFPCLSQP